METRIVRILNCLWKAADTALAAAVLALVGISFFRGSGNGADLSPLVTRESPAAITVSDENMCQDGACVPTGAPKARKSQKLQTKRSSPVVQGLRVNNKGVYRRVAKDIALKDWSKAPSSPAVDMREDAAAFEVAVSLPKRVDPASVDVRKNGNILSLSMRTSEGRTLRRRFLVPEAAGELSTQITNGVLQVRIVR